MKFKTTTAAALVTLTLTLTPADLDLGSSDVSLSVLRSREEGGRVSSVRCLLFLQLSYNLLIDFDLKKEM